jgi:hypothetical protein
MIRVEVKGDLRKTKKFLKKLEDNDIRSKLDQWGEMGVNALADATPVDTGLVARSWGYRIVETRKGPTIAWYNTNVEDGALVAILIQYGHGTGTGGYVQGRDYINPAMLPVFEKIANDVWRMMTS